MVSEDFRSESRFRGPALLLEHGVVSGVSVIIEGGSGTFGVFGVHTTKRRIFTEDDVNFLQTVANLVGEATERRQLARERDSALQQAHQQARLADIGAVSAKIVHDIGNPLAGLSMSAQNISRMLERQPAAALETVRRPLARVFTGIDRLDGIVAGLKDFLREQRLELTDFQLPELLHEIATFWETEASARRIRVVLEPPLDLFPIRGDVQKLRRVFDNLLKNAIEAIGQGPGHVKLGAGILDSDKISITVEDSGPGIPEGLDAFALFETTKPNGSGLGLAIVKEIVTAHGGGLDFARVQPHGTRFNLQLPRRGPAGV